MPLVTRRTLPVDTSTLRADSFDHESINRRPVRPVLPSSRFTFSGGSSSPLYRYHSPSRQVRERIANDGGSNAPSPPSVPSAPSAPSAPSDSTPRSPVHRGRSSSTSDRTHGLFGSGRSRHLPSSPLTPPPSPRPQEGAPSPCRRALQHLLNHGRMPQPSLATLVDAARILHTFLQRHGITSYFSGGFAAVYICDSPRATHDLDIIISAPQMNRFWDLVDSNTTMFPIVPRNISTHSIVFVADADHPWGGHFVECDFVPSGHGTLLKAPSAFPGEAGSGKIVKTKEGLRFLAPEELLKLKLASWSDDKRNDDMGKYKGDMKDICAVRAWLLKRGEWCDVWRWVGRVEDGLRCWLNEFRDDEEWDKLAGRERARKGTSKVRSW